eukprot:gene13336-17888_t
MIRYILSVTLLFQLVNAFNTTNIAVCITGQTGRLQPNYLLYSLINPTFNNLESRFNFHLLYVLTHTKDLPLIVNSDAGTRHCVSTYQNMSETDIIYNLHTIMNSSNGNSQVQYVEFVPPLSRRDWEEVMQQKNLDRMTSYTNLMHYILDMYHKQVLCAEAIQKLEQENNNLELDYIISTREDIWFFNMTLNLSNIIESTFQSFDCKVVAKNCQNYGGINMRFQLFPRDSGMKMLLNRIDFYKSLYTTNKVVDNPEQFELLQLQSYGWKPCDAGIDLIPATAARFMDDDSVCLANSEYSKSCIPSGKEKFVEDLQCLQVLSNGKKRKGKNIREDVPDYIVNSNCFICTLWKQFWIFSQYLRMRIWL